MEQKKTSSDIGYDNALELAKLAQELVFSEYWGTNEGITWEDGENLTAEYAYSIATGYCYNLSIRRHLIELLNTEASDYDAFPEEHRQQAHECLESLKVFEAYHSDEYRLHDLSKQISDIIHERATLGNDNIIDRYGVANAIETGKNYEMLVKAPLRNTNPETDYEKAIIEDIQERLKPYECEHQKTAETNKATDIKLLFLETAEDAANGKDGNFEFTCPLCDGYAIGTRKSWFGSILASCAQCNMVARGEIETVKTA